MILPTSNFARVLAALVFSVALVIQISGQTSVDQAYNGVPSLPLASPVSQQQALQADGKILIWGGSLAVNGVAKGRLVRLNSDGSLDNGFAYCHCGVDGLVNALPLSDGKILVGGVQSGVSKVIRLNNDGSPDASFNNVNPPNGFGSSTARVVAVQPDGKFYTYRTQSFQGFNEGIVFRFNADGSLDTSFSSVAIGSGSPNFTTLGAVLIAPDGKFYVVSNTFAPFSTSASLRRRNADGTADSSFTTPNFAPSTSWSIGGLALQADGALLVSGDFNQVNGVSKVDLVRLMPAGNVDLGFTAPAFLSNGQVQVLSNGSILYSARTDIGGITKIFRSTSDGSPDSSYNMSADVNSQLNLWVLDGNERTVFLGDVDNGPKYVRLLNNGALDSSFDPDVNRFGRIFAIARQPDGKVVAAGEFTKFNSIAMTSLVRTNSDGTIDNSYNAGTGFNAPPRKMILQPDGKLLAIGSFTSFNGTSVPGIVRLLPDGSIDPLFSVVPNAGSQILGMTLMADGRFLVTGTFSTVNGLSRAGVARLHTDGTVDNGFNALVGGSPTIYDVVVQPDGKVVIGGAFSGVGGFNRSNFVRLDSSGVLDQTFNPSVGGVGGIWLTPVGKFLITGLGGDSITIQRRNSDGSPDGSYTSQTFLGDNSQSFIDSVMVQPDGSAIIGGNFYTVGSNARKGIVRLTPNGSVDPLFLPRSSDGRVRAVVDGGSGKALVGGDFSLLESTTKAGLARLNVAPYRKVTLFDFDGDGKADFSVFRPSENNWYTLFNTSWKYTLTNFGLAGDIIAPGDYDGDGKTDLGIYRPSNGAWWYAASSLGGAHRTVSWGINGDIPRPADFDGDGKTDFVVFRPSNSTWYRMNSSGTQSSVTFGSPGDQPVIGDYDGDGKWDLAIFRPSTGDWWYAASSVAGQHSTIHFGQTGDFPAPADFDGDGKTDFAVFRPSEGGWYIWRSGGGPAITTTFGLNGDVPIPADYDGDGMADIAVYRPSTGDWYLLQSTLGFGALHWGIATDRPAPAAFVP